MKNTKIQWCHSTINPRMGCDGCELWKPATAIVAILLTTLMLLIRKPKAAVKQALDPLGFEQVAFVLEQI